MSYDSVISSKFGPFSLVYSCGRSGCDAKVFDANNLQPEMFFGTKTRVFRPRGRMLPKKSWKRNGNGKASATERNAYLKVKKNTWNRRKFSEDGHDALNASKETSTNNEKIFNAVEEDTLNKNETVPAKSETVPAESETVPAESETVPAESETVPAESETVPAESETVPAESETVPAESETVPAESETVPAESETVPAESETVPAESETVPAESETVPAESETVPAESETVPAESETVPAESETVPAESETVPAESETVPAESETVPAESETVPAESETVPAESETVPAKSETVPAKSETTSFDNGNAPITDGTPHGEDKTTPAKNRTALTEEETDTTVNGNPCKDCSAQPVAATAVVERGRSPIKKETDLTKGKHSSTKHETAQTDDGIIAAKYCTAPVCEARSQEGTATASKDFDIEEQVKILSCRKFREWYISCYCAGVSRVVIGFKDEEETVKYLKTFHTDDFVKHGQVTYPV